MLSMDESELSKLGEESVNLKTFMLPVVLLTKLN